MIVCAGCGTSCKREFCDDRCRNAFLAGAAHGEQSARATIVQNIGHLKRELSELSKCEQDCCSRVVSRAVLEQDTSFPGTIEDGPWKGWSFKDVGEVRYAEAPPQSLKLCAQARLSRRAIFAYDPEGQCKCCGAYYGRAALARRPDHVRCSVCGHLPKEEPPGETTP